ncbi:MAG TPA: hypothetical protein VK988_03910 [Acidimicrobiales bacterium]|nr:hypothetical protein [Acidimicrobiales bacterium]
MADSVGRLRPNPDDHHHNNYTTSNPNWWMDANSIRETLVEVPGASTLEDVPEDLRCEDCVSHSSRHE